MGDQKWKVASILDRDLMPIELSGVEQQSDCDSAADIELENLNDIIFEDDSLSERQYMQNIFICWFNFDFSINQYPSVCNFSLIFILIKMKVTFVYVL